MAPARKRGRQEMEAAEAPKEPTLLERIRNMWEFAALNQWIFIFGRAVKIDEDLDIEDLEMECLKTTSTVLPEIGLALLKFVSSHRGLTPEIFDEYTRRQYVAKAPERNPFGEEEEPAKFNDFDVFTKIRVLQQLTQWTMGNPDRIRERMEEQKDIEQAGWRIEPYGWDAEDRTYIVLDDNRLYRRTDPPPPPPPAPKPKKNSKAARAARRSSKRRKVSETVESEADPAEGDAPEETVQTNEYDSFGGMKWECLAVTLDEFTAFISTIEKSRDPNEKVLRKQIVDNVLPLLEKQEEARKRKQQQKERELLNIEKLAHAKRSSRIAGKMEQQKQEEEQRENERKKQAELSMAKKEQEKWNKLEKERESRMMTREQRLKEREVRRILHEEELANLSEDSKKVEAGAAEGRLSERHLKAEIERKKAALQELAVEDEDWIFDCICGAYGQIDDGTHSIACDKCNIWQHSKCVGVNEADADREDFSFVCKTCLRRVKDDERAAREAERAKTHPPIKIRFNARPGSSSSPILPPAKTPGSPSIVFKNNSTQNGNGPSQSSPQKTNFRYGGMKSGQAIVAPIQFPIMGAKHSVNAPQQGHFAPPILPPGYGQHSSTQDYGQSASSRPISSPKVDHAPSHQSNGGPTISHQAARPTSSHAFSSPQPHSSTSLPPPGQPQMHTFVNGNYSNYQSSGKTTSTSTQNHSPTRPALLQKSPPISFGKPESQPSNGFEPRPRSRGSVSMPSPLSSAPILTPSAKYNPIAHPNLPGPALSSPGFYPTPNLAPRTSPPQGLPPAATPGQPQPSPQQDVTATLPSAITGLSPTKHSPPRPSSNGSFSAGTPHTMLPLVSLSPSPQHQNLTPPVKHLSFPAPAGPGVGLEQSRSSGQIPPTPELSNGQPTAAIPRPSTMEQHANGN